MFKAYGEHFSFTPPQDIDAFLGTALVLDLLLSPGTGIGTFAPIPISVSLATLLLYGFCALEI